MLVSKKSMLAHNNVFKKFYEGRVSSTSGGRALLLPHTNSLMLK